MSEHNNSEIDSLLTRDLLFDFYGDLLPEHQKRIFERFYKVDKSRGLDSKSFGIGLYIVTSIVDLHSGTILVNSDGVTYTEFSVSLPMDAPEGEN